MDKYQVSWQYEGKNVTQSTTVLANSAAEAKEKVKRNHAHSNLKNLTAYKVNR